MGFPLLSGSALARTFFLQTGVIERMLVIVEGYLNVEVAFFPTILTE